MNTEAAAVATARSPTRRWLWRIVLAGGATGAALIALGLAELAARRWSPVPRPEPWEIESVQRAERFATRCAIPPRRPGQRRVVVVGESSAAMLAMALAAHQVHAPEPLEVIDCAQPGSALTHLPPRVDDALRARPDVLVLLFAHNLAFPDDPPWALGPLPRLARRSALVRAITGAPSPLVAPCGLERVAALERVLDDAARAAARQGVALWLVVPTGNLWFAPWEPSISEAEAVTRAQVRRALGRVDAGGEPPLTSLGPAARFERALLASARRDEDATQTALRAALAGSWSFTNRAPVEAAEAVRRVARRHHLGLLDADQLARAWYPPAPDWRHFTDACHPANPVMHRIAQALEAAAFPGRPAMPGEEPATEPREVATTLELLVRTDPRRREFAPWMRSVAAAVPQWLAAPEGERSLEAWLTNFAQRAVPAELRAFVLAGVAQGFQRAGRTARAADLYARSPAPEGGWVATEWALWLLEVGRVDEARRLLRRSSDEHPADWALDALDRLTRAPPP